MKSNLILLLLLLLFSSCKQDIPLLPAEPCTNASIHYPVITNGFSAPKYTFVIVESYSKNSKFDKLKKRYKIPLEKVNEPLRQERDFALPEEITTGFDLKLIFSKQVIFKITEMKSAWTPQSRKPFCRYQCNMVSYKLDGALMNERSTIFIENPDFNKKYLNIL